jgi:hypothetical protein
VTLELRITRTTASSTNMTLHRLLRSWGEGTSNAGDPGGRGATAQPNDTTWIDRFKGGAQWSVPGGDFDSTLSAGTSAGGTGSTTRWISVDALVRDVQGWFDDPSSNNGWLIRGDESENRTAKRFSSREGASPPTLTVVYTAAG